MGLIGDVKKLSKEYMKDPHGQFYRNLDKLIQIGINQGIPLSEIQKHVEDFK